MISWNVRRAGASAAGFAMCAVLVAGCMPSPAKTDPIVAGSASPTGSPQTQAAQAAAGLLDAFDAIPGATVSTKTSITSTVRSETWTVNASAASVYASAKARLPHWPLELAGAGRENDGGYSETVGSTSTGTLAEQSVGITVLPQGGGSKGSELEVDVEVVERLPKPAADHIPDSRVLTVTLTPVSLPKGAAGGGIVVGAGGTKTITSASEIAQIADELNALPLQPRYPAAYCPQMGAVPSLTFGFAPSAHAPASTSTVVVITTRTSGMCGEGVHVTVDGAPQPDLYHDAWLFTRFEKLTGFAS